MPVTVRAGLIFSPSQEYLAGIMPLLSKEELLISSLVVFSVFHERRLTDVSRILPKDESCAEAGMAEAANMKNRMNRIRIKNVFRLYRLRHPMDPQNSCALATQVCMPCAFSNRYICG
jgi:hypothetical protein